MRRINLEKAQGARCDTIRNINRQLVLNYVRERAPISRAEIAQKTALQRSTVSYLVDDLKAERLIEEFKGHSTGGRRPLLLQLRAAGAVAIGIDLGFARTIVAASDRLGHVLEQEEFASGMSRKLMLNRIVARVRALSKKHKRIEGIGISLPGVIDPETGGALFVPYFKWRNWAVAQEIKAATGLPVKIDNNANAAALAELWFGPPQIRKMRDFIFVLIEDGLSTGIVFDGQVYHGMAGAAGEFGHMTIGVRAPVACSIGNHECWEALASVPAARARYTKLSHSSVGHDGVSLEQLMDRALKGELAAKASLTETAHYLGVGISNLIKGLSPQAIIVGGQITRVWPLIAKELKKAVEENSVCCGLPSARIITSSLENPSLMGALSLVLSVKFALRLPI
ncbi:MAG: ROK family transcriptional regulator [Acidobacteriota bacterium]|nr:ROK family transcriptional regulator [Acidobacteriota bacterium]